VSSPYDVVKQFEQAVCEYTGAPFCVSVNSCTSALLLAVKWNLLPFGDRVPWQVVEIPKRTYVSVPMSIIHAGAQVTFRDEEWRGAYQLWPHPVWDAARRFKSMMYADAFMQGGGLLMPFVCVSFHAAKILGDTQGGAILHAGPEADAWFRRMRFDGRTEGVAPKDDDFREIGYHCYMSNDVAARLLLKLHSLPKYNDDLPNDDYPDLSAMEIFK